MITLNLNPQCGRSETTAQWQSPILTVNSESFDLSLLPDGATAKEHPVLGTVSRIGDDYECTITLGIGDNAPEESCFPVPIVVTENGSVSLPTFNAVEVDL